MKKYINKLFEWLGYVPSGIKVLYEEGKYFVNSHREAALNCENGFIVARRYEKDLRCGWCVLQCCENNEYFWTVKFFPDNADKDYARICAEELCEMLNEKY
jgi:hypothetical protein